MQLGGACFGVKNVTSSNPGILSIDKGLSPLRPIQYSLDVVGVKDHRQQEHSRFLSKTCSFDDAM